MHGACCAAIRLSSTTATPANADADRREPVAAAPPVQLVREGTEDPARSNPMG